MEAQTVQIKKEPSALYRWGVLVFISLAMFGNYYVYDSISPLADLLVKQLHFSDSDIGLLNAIYSFPNIIMVLIGGMIIDRLGTRLSTFIFAGLCFLGALLTAILPNLTVMAVGRLIFGLGAESLIVAITTVIGRWFKGKQLSFAFGLNLTIARLGSFAALNSPSWGAKFYANWQTPLLISVAAGMICIVGAVIYILMDVNASKNYAMREIPKQDEILIKEIFVFNKARLMVFIILLAAISSAVGFLNVTPFALLIPIVAFVNLYFGTSYKYIVLLCITFYSAMFPFQTFAVKFFMDVHGLPREMGGFLSSMLTLSAMILTPLFGLLSDRIGKRSLLMMIGSLLIIPVYLVMNYLKIGQMNSAELQAAMNFTQNSSSFLGSIVEYFVYFAGMVKVLIVNYPNLFIPMAVMGLSFSLVPAIMWPSVAIIVDESKLGTAYGLMTMIQNIGLFGVNLIIGWSNDFSGGYSLGMWIFSSLGFFGLVFAYLLRKSERGPSGHGLESGYKEKKS